MMGFMPINNLGHLSEIKKSTRRDKKQQKLTFYFAAKIKQQSP